MAAGRFGPCTVRYTVTGVTRKRKMPPWEFRSRPTDTPLRKMNWAGAASYLRNFFRYPGFVKQIPSSFPFPVTQRVRHRSLIYIQFFPRSNLGEGEEGEFSFCFLAPQDPQRRRALPSFPFNPQCPRLLVLEFTYFLGQLSIAFRQAQWVELLQILQRGCRHQEETKMVLAARAKTT